MLAAKSCFERTLALYTSSQRLLESSVIDDVQGYTASCIKNCLDMTAGYSTLEHAVLLE
jgi:hypothetical protein